MLELSENDFINLVGDLEVCFDRKKALGILTKHFDGSEADKIIGDILEEFGAVIEEKLGDVIDVLDET